VKLGQISQHTLDLMLVDVEQTGRIQPRSLRSMLYDVYGDDLLEGQPPGTELWLYVGTDSFTVARLKTRDICTAARVDLWRARDEGRDYGEALEEAFDVLYVRHHLRLPGKYHFAEAA
jgi:hypothetical protein